MKAEPITDTQLAEIERHAALANHATWYNPSHRFSDPTRRHSFDACKTCGLQELVSEVRRLRAALAAWEAMPYNCKPDRHVWIGCGGADQRCVCGMNQAVRQP